MKKRGNLYLSLVPHFEALALPITVRTSNAEAHADMYNNPSSLKKTQSETREHYIPRKHLPLLCFWRCFMNLRDSEVSKTKRQS